MTTPIKAGVSIIGNLRELGRALRPANLLPSLTVALVTGAYNVFIDIAQAALIFSGVLSPYLPAGIGLMLFSGIVYFLLISIATSAPGVIAAAQDGVLFAVLAAAITTRLQSTASPETIFYTVVAAIIATTLLEGVVYILLGRFGLGKLARYVPYSVIGGFLAGIGWVLVSGSVSVMVGSELTLETLIGLFNMPTLLRWLPAVIFAVVMLMITRRFKHHLIFPAMLATGIALFYAALAASGTSYALAQADGWLLGPFPGGALWQPLIVPSFQNADWMAIIQEAGIIASILFVGIVAMLLNVSAIELATRRDLDLNHEMQSVGVANIFSALAGGLTGYHDLQTTAMAYQLRANTRLTGIMLAATYLILLIFGPSLLSFVPKLLIGALLCFLGLQLLVEWVYDGYRKLSRSDFITITLILVTVAAFGFLQGFAVGVVAAVVLFAVNYSRINIVKHALTAASRRSNTDRSPSQQSILRRNGDSVSILELHGFLFFGTADNLLDQVRQHALSDGLTQLKTAILDFRLVTGVDSSAVAIFTKMQQLAERQKFTLILTSLSDSIQRKLTRHGLNLAETPYFKLFPDLDRGLEWGENRIIQDAQLTITTTREPLERLLRASFPKHIDVTRLMKYLTEQPLAAGETLFKQGESADALYFVEKGALTALLDLGEGKLLRLRTVSGGATIGEMALYSGGGKRAATVVAEQESVIYCLRFDDLAKMEKEEPEVASAFHQYIAKLLAVRLADNNNLIEALTR